MKKALALFGTLILIVSIVPMGAFADSDPGFSNLVLNHSFSWYSDFPYVDTYGWIYNSYLQSATLVSNGVISYPSPSTVPTLYQAGDYFEVSFDSDLLSTYQTPLWNVMIAYDSSTASTHFDIPLDSINCYLCDELAFYDFQTELSADGRRWRCISFISPSNYLSNTTIRIEYNGNGAPITVPITMICIRGYRYTPSGSLTEQEMVELQSNIVDALNVARLADIIGNIDTSDIDLTTLETTTTSILNALAILPTIHTDLNNIYNTDQSMLSAINTFYNLYYSIYTPINYTNIEAILYDNNFNITSNNSYKEYYIVYPISFGPGYLSFLLSINGNPDYLTSVSYAVTTVEPTSSNYNNLDFKDIYFYTQKSYPGFFDLYLNTELFTQRAFPASLYEYKYIVFHIKSDSSIVCYTHQNRSSYFYKQYNTAYLDIIVHYLRQFIYSDSNFPSDIETTTQQIEQQAETVDTFHQSAETDLNTGLQNVPVTDYQITATTGTQYMKQYTENLFTASNGFRIWFMYPLILATIGLLIRWRFSR